MEEKVVRPIVNTQIPAAQPVAPPVPNTTPFVAQVDSKKEQPVGQLTDLENKVKDPSDPLIPSDPYYLDPLFYEVANYLNVSQEEYGEAKNQLSEIVDYVIKAQQSNKPEDVLKGIREIKDRIQTPQWGERWYKNIYRYVRLAAKSQVIQEQMKAFEVKEPHGQ